MKFIRIHITFLFLVSFTNLFHAQLDSAGAKSSAMYSQNNVRVDEAGESYYYDKSQRAKIYDINGEKVIVLDELTMVNKPKFNNHLDRNYYFFLNKKLNRVYPMFLTALQQYRELSLGIKGMSGKEKRQFIRQKQLELANQYEAKLRDLATSEGRVFAKLMYRATGKTVYSIIKDLRGGWSAFWWNVKGNIAEVDLKEPYDPHRFRNDQFVENLLQTNWAMGYLKPYPGYKDFKVVVENSNDQ